MSAANVGMKRRWLISALGALIVTALLLAIFRTLRIPLPAARTARPPVPVDVRPGTSHDLALLSLKPLFLPTAYNAAPPELAEPKPGGRILALGANHLTLGVENPRIDLPPVTRVPASPAEVLADHPEPLALGIGRTNAAIAPWAAHGAYVEVFAASRDTPVLDLTLGVEARPTSTGRETLDWHPLEFMAAVDRAGLIGPLVLTASSGAEEVDNHFRNYLARTVHLGDRLPPGFYRIVVGP